MVAETKNASTTLGGIILEGAAGTTKIFKVIDCGPDVQNMTAGNKVLVNFTKSIIISDEGKQFLLIEEEDILAVVS